MELLTNYNETLWQRYLAVARKGCRRFDFMGGRRSGKSWTIEQILLPRMLRGEVVNVATMTSEQGRLGVYADVCDIIDGSPSMQPWVEVQKTPRQVICKANRGRMFFNTYSDPERAKGIACDWLYINEANNFTERQYIDLSASVRRGIFCDRNPNSDCWTERNGFTLIHSTWKDNIQNLPPQQIEWFEGLKRKAESPNATAADIYYYRVYYLGEYAELRGSLFTPENIQLAKKRPPLHKCFIFADPSNMVGADFFAMVLCGVADNLLYIVDTYSDNISGFEDAYNKIEDWCKSHDVHNVFIETNGVGRSFWDFCRKSAFPLRAHVARGNKHERIIADFHGITERVLFADTPANTAFLGQVYKFEKGCDKKGIHDDNIDAVDSAYRIARYTRLID